MTKLNEQLWLSSFNSEQKHIYYKLKEHYREEFDSFMSTPNKLFRNRAPIDLLSTKDYSYFHQFAENA